MLYQHALLYPKYKGGGHIVRKLMEDCTYGKLLHIYHWLSLICVSYIHVGYVDDIPAELWKIVGNSGSVETERVISPPPLCRAFEQGDRKKAIEEHRSRFS